MPTTPLLRAPHEQRVCDIRDAAAVVEAARGATSIVSMMVNRHDPVQAWDVNLGGTLNILDAAHAHGVRRVVVCGPSQKLAPHPVGFQDDHWVPDDVPPHPGHDRYWLTQFLAQEATRVLAREWQMSCVIVLFVGLGDPADTREIHRPLDMLTSWTDAGAAIAAAVRVDDLSEEVLTVEPRAHGPHGRQRRSAAETLLGWSPRVDMSPFWWHPDADE